MSQENAPSAELHDLEMIISKLLRVGVLVAGGLLLIGWVWLWINNGDMLKAFSNYETKSFFETVEWALVQKDRAMLISLTGLVVLVCLPLLRVLMTGILFIKQKDYVLATMAFLVFFVLVGSFCLGVEIS